MELAPYAVATFFLYSVGFVGFIYSTLTKNQDVIKEDQYLRAQGYGNDSTKLQLGGRVERIRTRYSRIYYHFRPQYYYWIMLIIARKTAIALTSLLYRKNPSFQFAVALLVMFIAYVLQVKHQPYMSPSQFSKEIDVFNSEANDNPDGLYGRIKEITDKRLHHIRKRENRNETAAEFGRVVRQSTYTHAFVKNNSTFQSRSPTLSERLKPPRVARFNINYNSVEAVLLGCSVFVCLAGICFQNADEAGPFARERKSLTWVTLFVVLSSIIYFMVVLLVEVSISKGYAWSTKKIDVEKTKHVELTTMSSDIISESFEEPEESSSNKENVVITNILCNPDVDAISEEKVSTLFVSSFETSRNSRPPGKFL